MFDIDAPGVFRAVRFACDRVKVYGLWLFLRLFCLISMPLECAGPYAFPVIGLRFMAYGCSLGFFCLIAMPLECSGPCAFPVIGLRFKAYGCSLGFFV